MKGIIERAVGCNLGSKAIVDLSQHMPGDSAIDRVKQAQLALIDHVQRCFNGNYEEFRRKMLGKTYDYTLTIMQEYHKRFLGL